LAPVSKGQVKAALDSLFANQRTKDPLVAGLSGRRAFFRWLDLPPLPGAKLRQAAAFELEDHLPTPVEELLTDVARSSGNRALVFAMDKGRIEAALESLTEARLNPQAISLDTVGLLTAAEWAGVEDGVLLDLGQSKSTVLCLAGGLPVGLAFLDTAGAAFDRSLARARGWTMSRARAHKEALSNQDEAIRLFKEPLEELAAGVANVIGAAYPAPDKRPQALYFSGGLSRLPGLERYLSETLSLPPAALWPLGQPVDPEMIPALGLALSGDDFNLARGKLGQAASGAQLKLVAAAVVLVLILGGANIYTRLSNRQDILAQLKTAELKIFKENLPHVKRVVSPLKQLEVEYQKAREELTALTRGEGQRQVLETLLGLNKIIEAHGVRLKSLQVEGSRVLLRGQAAGFEALDGFRSALEGEKEFGRVEIESSRIDPSGQGVAFRMRIERR